jgi:hypothetical protein
MSDRGAGERERTCPLGNPGAGYTCEFCQPKVRLHRGDDPNCGCSTLRREVTHYSTLCHTHAQAIDELTADSAVGTVHRALVRKADLAGRRSGDD